MKPIEISRRQVLEGLLVAPIASLVGCGGGSGSNGNGTGSPGSGVSGSLVPAGAPVSTPGQVKPVVVYFQYAGDTVESVEKNLNTIPNNVSTTPDRFGKGALCYEFDGAASQVTVEGIAGFPQQDFAVLFWAKNIGLDANGSRQTCGDPRWSRGHRDQQ